MEYQFLLRLFDLCLGISTHYRIKILIEVIDNLWLGIRVKTDSPVAYLYA